MYITIITFKDGLNADTVSQFTKIANSHYNNRCGQLENASTDANQLVYKGDDEEAFNVIMIGNLSLYHDTDIKGYLQEWTYEDTDEGGVEDVLECFAFPIKGR